jgi:hypothetical protein
MNEIIFDKVIASGLVGVWIDLFAGGFESAVTKYTTIELNNFDRAVTMWAIYKHIYILYRDKCFEY